MYPEFKTDKIKLVISPDTHLETKINFEDTFGKEIQLTSFPEGGSFCNIDDSLYFSGGKETLKGVGKIFFKLSFDLSLQKIIITKLPSMTFSHFNHSMTFCNGQIYVIGGYNSNKCEKFDIKTGTWQTLPDLVVPERQRPILIVHNNFLYAFMGISQINPIEKIERLNLNNPNGKWENLPFVNSDKVKLGFWGCGIFRVKSSNKYAFLGGKYANEEGNENFIKEIIYFNFDEKKFTKMSNELLKENLLFYESNLFEMGDNNYSGFTYTNGQVSLLNFEAEFLNNN